MTGKSRALVAAFASVALLMGLVAGVLTSEAVGAQRPVVTEVTPSAGPVAGGGRVVIKGQHLRGVVKVLFGDARATIISSRRGRIAVAAPPHGPGVVVVRVVTDSGRSRRASSSRYAYEPVTDNCHEPSLSSLDPGNGSVDGGERVRILGSLFAPGARVTFGGTPGIDVVVHSSGELYVTAPSHSWGAADVEVTTCGPSGTGAGSQFFYVPHAPVVTSVSPAQGPVEGGTRVTVRGANFDDVTKVHITDTPWSDVQVISEHELRATSPEVFTDLWSNLVVDAAGGSSNNTDDAALFRYVLPPKVQSISPTYGPAGQTTRVTITGSSFTGLGGVTEVLFGDQPGTDLDVVSDTELKVTAPPQPGGPTKIRVTNPVGTGRNPTTYFAYESAPGTGTTVVAPVPGGGTSPSHVEPLSVSCWAPSQCLAVGWWLGANMPLVERLSGSTWTASSVTPPGGVTSSGLFSSVSCTAADFCAAVGSYMRPGDAWARPLLAVWNGATWSLSSLSLDTEAQGDYGTQFVDIDCVARTCTAVARIYESATATAAVVSYQAGTWSAVNGVVHHLDAFNAVDCIGSQCVVVGGGIRADGTSGFVVLDRPAGSWDRIEPPRPPDASTSAPYSELKSVSCSTVESCMAVGAYRATEIEPLASSSTSGVWSQVEVAVPASLRSEYGELDDVSCTTDRCLGVGRFTTRYREGSFESYTSYVHALSVVFDDAGARVEEVAGPDADPVDPRASLARVECTVAGACAGVGSYTLSGSRWHGLAMRVSGSGAIAPAEITAAEPGYYLLMTGLALDSATTAVGVGYYQGDDGYYHGQLVTGLPVG